MHDRMHALTNEDALLSASRSVAALTGEELIRDTNDNSGTISELKQWLSPPDHLVNHVDAHPETGKWFIQSETFQWWEKEKGASLFICGESMFF